MRYLILGLLCLMAGIAYIQRAAISVPTELIAADLKITNFEKSMGWVQSAWYFGYALLQVPAGRMADLYGSRRTLVMLCSLWSAVTLLTGFSTGWYSLMFLWFLMGAFQAGAFPSAASAISQTFQESERAKASGILAAGMAVGGAVAPMLAGRSLSVLEPLASSLKLYPWQLLLFLFSLPGFLWSGLFLMAVPPSTLPVIAQPKVLQPEADAPTDPQQHPTCPAVRSTVSARRRHGLFSHMVSRVPAEDSWNRHQTVC